MLRGVRRILDSYPDVKAIYPVHMNPQVRAAASEVFEGCKNMRLTEPMNIIDFHNIMAKSYLVLTDSGGVQEEAPSLNKPVLVMRDNTERPEGVDAGTLRLAGTNERAVYEACRELLDDRSEYLRMSLAKNPYGDGNASQRIAEILERRLA